MLVVSDKKSTRAYGMVDFELNFLSRSFEIFNYLPISSNILDSCNVCFVEFISLYVNLKAKFLKCQQLMTSITLHELNFLSHSFEILNYLSFLVYYGHLCNVCPVNLFLCNVFHFLKILNRLFFSLIICLFVHCVFFFSFLFGKFTTY